MTIENLTGQSAVEAGSDAEFTGTANPRNYRISESLMDQAMTLMDNAIKGRWGANIKLAEAFYGVNEAFSTSDFTLAAFAAIDTEMMARFDELPANWRAYTTVTTVNDFRPKRLLDKWRTNQPYELVPEYSEYPEAEGGSYGQNNISVAKYGRRRALSWEAWINNEAIDELEDIPASLASGARETENLNAIRNLILADGTDVNTAFFKAGNSNAPTALDLTLENVDAVLTAMSQKKSAVTGGVQSTPPLQLVIPKALETQAQRILAVKEIRDTNGNRQVTYDNYVNFDYVVEPALDRYLKHANVNKTWFVLPKPGSSVRPALYAAYLRGHEAPDLRVRAATGQRVGGGQVSPLEGSFENDDIQYRGRMVVGRQQGDPTYTYVSRGA